MEVRLEQIDEEARKAYERFFFERICSMSVADRKDFTIPLPQIEGLYFTSVQDTVERLTEVSGRLSTFQWRNCIFAPISRSVRVKDIYQEVFQELKSQAPSLFVRSYVYLVFIKLEPSDTSPSDLGEAIQPTTVCPSKDDYQIYYWNTKYQISRGGKSDLFRHSSTNAAGDGSEEDGSLDDDDAGGIENDPKKLFIVENPAHELQRIQDANSDIIDAFRAFNSDLRLVGQTESYLDEVTRELDRNEGARVLVEGPARSGKTVLAMSLLARYPKSKMLLMNWYFWDALIEAFKLWSELSIDEIEQLFVMPEKTREPVDSGRRGIAEFSAYQADPRRLDVALQAVELPTNPKLPRWCGYTDGLPTPEGAKADEWRVRPVTKSAVGDPVPVIRIRDTERVAQIVTVMKKHEDESATVERVSGIREFALDEDQKARLLEYKSEIEAARGGQYIAEMLKGISDALHDSPQRFFHHDIKPERTRGCWIERGNPTFCNISDQDLVICDEVQRLGLIDEYHNRDAFDETQEILRHSDKLFLCGDDFQMLNPKYDQGIGAIEEIDGGGITRLRLPGSIGVPAEVIELIKYLLDEHGLPERSSRFEIQLLHRDDTGFVELFGADRSTKKHYAIPNNYGWYRTEPYILRASAPTKNCTSECGPSCKHQRIPMLPESLRERFKFFCSEAVMPNFALSAYELISREVESVYLKIPEEIGVEVVRRPMARESGRAGEDRNWKKQHLYVLMTRATMRLVINVEDRALYEYLRERLRLVSSTS